jgi:hypothetical protein
MKLNELRQKLIEAQQDQILQQKPKNPSAAPQVAHNIRTAKTVLGLKDLNVAAAIAGHKLFMAQSQKNPNAPINQIFAKIPPNARKQYTDLAKTIPSDMLNAPTSQFRMALQRLRTVQGNIKEEVELLDEELAGDPPMMVVLKRKGIRIFPDGKRVALYVNEKLGLTFTVPYTPAIGKIENPMVGVTEETEVEEIMESLEQVAAYASQENPKSTSKHMKFADGSKLKVSHGAAKAIHMVHSALNDQNKKHFETMLAHPKSFEKAAHFALSKVNFTINK